MSPKSVSAAIRITAIYVVVASLWIIGSDRLVELLDPGAVWLQSVKGLLFVATTAALLYGLIQADHRARERAETQIRHQARLLDQTLDAIISTDMEFIVQTFNPGAERLYGWKAEEAIGKSFVDLVQTRYENSTREDALKVITETGDWHGEVSQVRKDGARRYFHSAVSFVTDSAGKRVGLVSVNRDITEQRQLEEERLLTQFSVDHASIGIMRTGFDAQILSVNEHYCRISGYTAGELIGMHIYDIDPDYPLEKWKAHRDGLRQTVSDTFETRHRRKDGVLIPVEVTTTFVTFRGEEFSLSFVQDITERKRAEEEIGSLAKFPSENPGPILRVANDGLLLYANKVAERTLPDWHLEPGRPVPDILKDAVAMGVAAGRLVEVEIAYDETTYSFHVAPILEGGYANLYGRNITRRKQAEHLLRESQEKFSTAFQSSPVGLVITTPDGVYVEVNPAFCNLTGYSYEEVLGKTSLELSLITPEASQNVVTSANQSDGKLRNIERMILTKDGRTVYAVLSLESITLDGIAHRLATLQDITERKQAEQRIQQQALELTRAIQEKTEAFTLLDTLMSTSPVGMAFVDDHLRFRRINTTLAEINGIPAEDHIGHTLQDVLPELAPTVEPLFRQVIQTRRPIVNLEVRGETPLRPGEQRDWLASYYPVIAPDGAVLGVGLNVVEITERKRSEEAMRASEERFRMLVDISPIALFVNRGGVIDFANPAFLKLAAAAGPEQVLGRSPLDFFVPEHHTAIQERIRHLLSNHTLYSPIDEQMIGCDGAVHDVEVTASRFIDRDGQAIQVMLNDITERKRAEHRIKKLNRVYAVLSSINETIVRIRDPQELFGIACEIAVEKGSFMMAWIGLTDTETGRIRVVGHSGAPAEYFEDMVAKIQPRLGDEMPVVSVLRTGQPLILNDARFAPVMRPVSGLVNSAGVRSGAVFPIRIAGQTRGAFSLYSNEPNLFDDEEVRLLNELVTDISFALDVGALETQRSQAEQQVRESRERLQSTLDNMMEGCQIIDYDWRYRYINDAAVEHGQSQREKLLGRTMMEAYPGIDQSEMFDTLKKCMSKRTSARMVNEFVYPDGSSRWFELSIQPVPEGLFILSTDITVRKQAEDVQRRLNVELEQRVAERTAQLRHVKERVEAIINNSPDAILLLGPSGSIDVGNPAFSQWYGYDRDVVRGRRLADLAAPESAVIVDETLKQVIAELATQRVEIKAQRSDGSLFDVGMALAPILEADQLLGVVCSLQDISKRKEVERMKDAFVSNVSHELRTPITSIRLNQKLIRMNPDREPAYLERMEREVGRLNDLIEDLLRLSRLDAGRTELNLGPVDLNHLVDEHVDDRSSIAESRSLTLSADKQADLPLIEADGGLLGQALSVLLTNALNYTPAGGAVVLRTLTTRRGSQTWVGFQVCDTGPGIPLEEMSHLFERFYRGKIGRDSGKSGTGLGLAIAQEIVARHHGQLEAANNDQGLGATFSVWLPDSKNE